MSKYIRTNDRIVKSEDYHFSQKYNCYVPDNNLPGFYSFTEDEILGQSDNLENLLDAFLCENKLGQGTCSRDFTELKRDALHYTWQQFSITGKTWDDLQYSFYGLIKVNHNLICVAKYNEDKKEWEMI